MWFSEPARNQSFIKKILSGITDFKITGPFDLVTPAPMVSGTDLTRSPSKPEHMHAGASLFLVSTLGTPKRII
jgi:hypothetical protein